MENNQTKKMYLLCRTDLFGNFKFIRKLFVVLIILSIFSFSYAENEEDNIYKQFLENGYYFDRGFYLENEVIAKWQNYLNNGEYNKLVNETINIDLTETEKEFREALKNYKISEAKKEIIIKQALEIFENHLFEKAESMVIKGTKEQIEKFKQELFLTHDNFLKINSKFLENQDYNEYCSGGSEGNISYEIIKRKDNLNDKHEYDDEIEYTRKDFFWDLAKECISVPEEKMSVAEAGRKLRISRNELFAWLRVNKFLKTNNEPYKKYDGKYFIREKVKYRNKRKISSHYQTFVLPKGLELIKKDFLASC